MDYKNNINFQTKIELLIITKPNATNISEDAEEAT
jgi:hypothetical protein